MSLRLTLFAGLALCLSAGASAAQEQSGDLDWRPQGVVPAYAEAGPLIRIDQGHGSLQTIEGRYAGFAALLRADGYRVEAGLGRLDEAGALRDVAVLVVVNPAAPADGSRISAFDPGEIEAAADWVSQGGSLLLVADHAPHGSAAEALAERFGVKMGKGYAFQRIGDDLTANLTFPSQALGDHPIIAGRNEAERVRVVKTFTGQSLEGPAGSTVLMAMSADALEATDREALQAVREGLARGERAETLSRYTRPAFPAQGLAFSFGRGRVVVLGEAAMLTAQIIRFPDQPDRAPVRFGLNTEGHDDQQFALNLAHWLSRLIP